MGSGRVRTNVHVGEVVRNAVVFNFKSQDGDVVNAESLFENVERLFALLHEREIGYLLVGGVAML